WKDSKELRPAYDGIGPFVIGRSTHKRLDEHQRNNTPLPAITPNGIPIRSTTSTYQVALSKIPLPQAMMPCPSINQMRINARSISAPRMTEALST
ncbi:MAG TPA: hypothetical protein VGD41_14910, partial [Pyrinomonadaceae bacterium]